MYKSFDSPLIRWESIYIETDDGNTSVCGHRVKGLCIHVVQNPQLHGGKICAKFWIIIFAHGGEGGGGGGGVYSAKMSIRSGMCHWPADKSKVFSHVFVHSWITNLLDLSNLNTCILIGCKSLLFFWGANFTSNQVMQY